MLDQKYGEQVIVVQVEGTRMDLLISSCDYIKSYPNQFTYFQPLLHILIFTDQPYVVGAFVLHSKLNLKVGCPTTHQRLVCSFKGVNPT